MERRGSGKRGRGRHRRHKNGEWSAISANEDQALRCGFEIAQERTHLRLDNRTSVGGETERNVERIDRARVFLRTDDDFEMSGRELPFGNVAIFDHSSR
jgi:hypothetical protein